MHLFKKFIMPWIEQRDDPSYPYAYSSKPKYDGGILIQQPRLRLPHYYFDKGYNYYSRQMKLWYKDLERQGLLNRKKYYPKFNNDDENYRALVYNRKWNLQHPAPETPIFYSWTEYKRKANKYTYRKRQQYLIKQRIDQNRQQAIAKRKRLNLIKKGFIRPSK